MYWGLSLFSLAFVSSLAALSTRGPGRRTWQVRVWGKGFQVLVEKKLDRSKRSRQQWPVALCQYLRACMPRQS